MLGRVVGGRFEVRELAGRGAVGVVYRARDLQTGCAVALKVLRDLVEVNAERFALEAQLLEELEHPAIVRYVAHGLTTEGEPYLVMEWLEGPTLRDHIQSGAMPVRAALELGTRVADALACAHRRGVVHRDLKPSNLVLVNGEPALVKVVDFGLARAPGRRRARTMTGDVLGTPGYMAPEQARGERTVDARSDVFALGCVLFECLTGARAFGGGDLVAVMMKIVLEDAPRLRDVAPLLPEALDELLARMLAKAPDARPADGGAVVKQLAAITALGDEAPTSRPGPSLTADEQRVLALVLVGVDPGSADDDGGVTVSLDRIATAANGRFEPLADGTHLLTFSGTGSANDHAARAARSALAIRAELPRVPIVLATGWAVVGRAQLAGEVIDRAAQLLAEAEVRTAQDGAAPVVVDEVSAALLDPRFEVGGAGGRDLLAERRAVGRVRTLLGKPTRCVGRERELMMIRAMLDECVEEHVARVVLVEGPAGVGKSRLRYELVRQAAARDEPITTWTARGDPVRAGAPLGMIAELVREASGLRDGESPELRRKKLVGRVIPRMPLQDAARVAEFLGEIVGGVFPDDSSAQLRAARADPLLMGDQMLRAWIDFIDAETRVQPLLVVLEDLHWGDVATVRFVDVALGKLRDRPILVLAVARREVHDLFPGLWASRRFTTVPVRPLTRRASEELVLDALGKDADPKVIAAVVERADGYPFHLEELARSVAEGRWVSASDAPPATVVAMVQARLEAMDPADRRVLRAASIFGKTFWYGGVRALLADARGAGDCLSVLAEREVLERRPTARFTHEEEYVFRHPLVRDAAYAMLTEADRTLGHRLAARWLERVGETEAAVLAEHAERGGEPSRAISWYRKAAEDALEANDFAAVIARVDKAVAAGATGETLGALRLVQAQAHTWLSELLETAARAREAAALLPRGSPAWCDAASELCFACATVGDERGLRDIFADISALGEHSDPDPRHLKTWARSIGDALRTSLREEARALIDRLEQAVAARPALEPDVRAWTQRARSWGALYKGDLVRSLEFEEDAAALFEEIGDLRQAARARAGVGYMYKEIGAYERAEADLRQALSSAERLGLRTVAATAQHNLGAVLASLGRLEEAIAIEREALAYTGDDYRIRVAARVYLARILLAAGDTPGAADEARRAIEEATDDERRAIARAAAAQAYLAEGRVDAALADAREAMRLLDACEVFEEGEATIRLAYIEALLSAGMEAEAEAALARALERLVEAADRFTDPAWRSSFLERVPDNARTIELAISRGLTAPAGYRPASRS